MTLRLPNPLGVVALWVLTIWLVFPAQTQAQQGGSVDGIGAIRIQSGAIQLDGQLTETVWTGAGAVSDFRQREPLEGEPATERTEVYVAFDDMALYVAVRAFDSEPGNVVARLLQRDRIFQAGGFGGLSFGGDDAVAILLDPFHDHRNGIVLATNPNGAEFDALVTDEGAEVNVDWRGIWEVAATRTPDGWSAEFAIPWRTLRYPDSEEAPRWGLNVSRIIQRKKEEVLWQSWSRDGGGFERISQAGHIDGLTDLPRQGLNVEVKPFTLGTRTQLPNDSGGLESSGTGDVGLDVKAELRPGLVLDLTANTDFAQVEVDDAQVNLTRFDLFFPEKREFFLENAGIFEFGQRGFGGAPPFLMFFSRNIGISPDGEIPIDVGARLTGRVGNQTVGFLNVVTGAEHGVEREVFNVARVKRDVGESNFIGAMVTDRRGSGDASTSAGVDARFALHPTVTLTGFASKSFSEGAGGDGLVYQTQVDFTADVWGGFFEHLAIEPDAVAASGFINRTDIRQTQLVGRRTFRPDLIGLRRLELRLISRYQTTHSGDFQDWESGPWLSSFWESGDNMSIRINAGESQVDESFTLAGIVDVPAGRYRAEQWTIDGSTSTARPWSLSANARGAEFFGGDLMAFSGTVSLSPTPSFLFSLGVSHNDVELPSGAFTADITTLRAAWALSTKVTTNALIQHNSLTDRISTNIRFNLIHRPGSDLFVVFTEGRGLDGELWDVSSRGLAVKLTYLMRL